MEKIFGGVVQTDIINFEIALLSLKITLLNLEVGWVGSKAEYFSVLDLYFQITYDFTTPADSSLNQPFSLSKQNL